MDGYILIHRKLLEWEWYSSINDTRLFIHCLLKANWKDGKFRGVDVPRGSFITSIRKLAKETGLTTKQVRVSLDHLKMTHEVAHTTTSKYSIITINKYNEYQVNGTQDDKQRANKGQTKGNNRIKEIKEINKKNISKDIQKKVFVKPTIDAIADYCNERNNNVDPERFYNFYESKGWMVGSNKMKDWKACVRTWEQRQPKEKLPEWFDKDFKENERSEEDERQLQELIRGY